MECRDVTAQLADYLAGTLDEGGMDRVREHVAGCAACREEIEGLDDMWQALGTIPAEHGDLPAMRARLDAAIAAYQHGLEQPAGQTPTRIIRRDVPSWRLPRVALQAAAAIVLLAGGVAIGRQWPASGDPSAATTPADAQLAALRQELGEMRQMFTLSLLQQQSASERLRGVTFTSQIPQPGIEVVSALLDALAGDQNVNVRLASIDALERFSDLDVVRRATLEALPRQTSPLVQITLIDFVAATSGAASAPTLRQISTDEMLDQAVRRRAAQSLAQLGM